jgi:superfamily II DNA or RNA helicase
VIDSDSKLCAVQQTLFNCPMAATLRLPALLWPHQKAAIKTIHGYLAEADTGGTAALITMPTGTGKSGVIAWSVTQLPELKRHRLVITPWTALTRQLREDIEERFWTRLSEKDKPKRMPPVQPLPPSTSIAKVADAEENTVFVATIAAISTLYNKCLTDGTDIARLFKGFGAVFVDEGHYEPAENWSKAIRALRLPAVLLTATPYRNDLKYFEIGAHRFRLPHHTAEEERFLRKPEFRVLHTTDVATFATRLKALVGQEFPGDDGVRVIVRCKDAPTIRAMVSALKQLGEEAIGIHERFADEGDFRKAVPQRDAPGSARYWVHQNKLIEGIDDPSFKVVALFDSLRNGRAIVQQIGRVLRNPARAEENMKAIVVGRGDRDLEEVWHAYMTFDREDLAESVATMSDLVDRLVDSQPLSFYLSGNYRVRIDLTSPSAWETFAYPLRTRVFRRVAEEPITIDSVAAATAAAWEAIDRTVFTIQRPDDKTAVVPYITVENSPLLRAATFIEPQFGYTALRLSGDLLFVYDARGRVPHAVLESFAPLRASELTRLFPGTSSRISTVSLRNTDIGRQAARSRHVRASAIDDLAPDLADYGYICTIAEGQTGEGAKRTRRYVGLSRARLTDHRATEGDFETYSSWLNGVEADVRGPAQAAATFSRYATYAPVPADPSPLHVLLDIDQTGYARQEAAKTFPLELEDTAYEVSDGSFEIYVGDKAFPATLAWDGRGYELQSALQLERYEETVPDGRELVDAINEDQLLRVVPAERGVIYSHGEFITPRSLRAAAGILTVLQPVPRLATISTEKGAIGVANDWEADSIFGVISALAVSSNHVPEPEMAALLGSPDLLVCTDLGAEIADFMALKADRVVFIHAKAASSVSPLSASALHDVVSQAVKNLPYLQPFDETKPKTAYWTNDWKAKDNGRISRRRAGTYTTGSDAWKQLRAVIANPQANREVWLVMGQSLSVARLREELDKQQPAPQVLQIFSLLQTVWSATSQIGARLRIFCSP